MVNFKRTKLSLAIISATALSGCFGGASSPSSSATDGPTTDVSGKVVDGYIEGALVCFDTNSNLVCDSGEPSATSDANGQFTLKGIPESALSEYKSILAVLSTEDSIDKDTGLPVIENTTLSLSTKGLTSLRDLKLDVINNGGTVEDKTNAIISPASHIVNTAIQSQISTGSGESLIVEQEVAKAKQTISDITGINLENTLKDWVMLREQETSYSAKLNWWKAQQITMSAVLAAQKEISTLSQVRADFEVNAATFQQALLNATTFIQENISSFDAEMFDNYDFQFLEAMVSAYDNEVTTKYYDEISAQDGAVATLAGRVSDTSFIAGAKVCIDENDNLACDIEEVSTTTDADGYFILKGVAPEIVGTYASIIAEIPADNSSSLSQTYVMSALLDNIQTLEQQGISADDMDTIKESLNLFISPVSHYINTYVKSKNETLADELQNLKLTALSQISTLTEASTSELESDLVDTFQSETDNSNKIEIWKKIEILSALITAASKEAELFASVDSTLEANYANTATFLQDSFLFVSDYIVQNTIPDSLTTTYVQELVLAYETFLKINNYEQFFQNEGTFSLVGNVIFDSYVSNAKVCLDLNHDLACGDDEPSTMSDEQGYFELSGIPLEHKNSFYTQLVSEIQAGTSIDVSTGTTFSEDRKMSANLNGYASKTELELQATAFGVDLKSLIQLNIGPASHYLATTLRDFISQNPTANDFALNLAKQGAIDTLSSAFGYSAELLFGDLVAYENNSADATEAQYYWFGRQILKATLNAAYADFAIQLESNPSFVESYAEFKKSLDKAILAVKNAIINMDPEALLSYSASTYNQIFLKAQEEIFSAELSQQSLSNLVANVTELDAQALFSNGVYSVEDYTTLSELKTSGGGSIVETASIIINSQVTSGLNLGKSVYLAPGGMITYFSPELATIGGNYTLDFGSGTINGQLYELTGSAKNYLFGLLTYGNTTTDGAIYVRSETVSGEIYQISQFDKELDAATLLSSYTSFEENNGHTIYSYNGKKYIIYDNVVWSVKQYIPSSLNMLSGLAELSYDNIMFDSTSYADYQASMAVLGVKLPTIEENATQPDVISQFISDDYVAEKLEAADENMSITCSDTELFDIATNRCYTPTFEPKITGKVLDTYVENALVCIDTNKNWACDATEPQATTDNTGTFEITGFDSTDLDDRSEYLLAEIISGLTIDSSSTTPYDFNAILSLNFDSLAYDASGNYYSTKNSDKGVYISPFAHEVNVTIRNLLENGASASSPVVDQQVDTKEKAVASVFGNDLITSSEIYDDLYKKYLNGGLNYSIYKAQQYASALIKMQNAYQVAKYTSQASFVLNTANLYAQHASFENEFANALGMITPTDEGTAGFTYPDYITDYYFNIVSTGTGISDSTGAVALDTEGNIEIPLRSSGLYQYKEISVNAGELSYVADKINSVNTTNFVQNTVFHDSLVSPVINQVDHNDLATYYDKFSVGLNGDGVFGLNIPNGVVVTSETLTFDKLLGSYDATSYLIDTDYATRVVKAAFGLDDTVKDNMFSNADSKVYYLALGSIETYTIIDDTSLDYAADVVANYDEIYNINGTEVVLSGGQYYTEINGVTFLLAKQAQSLPNSIPEDKSFSLNELLFTEQAWEEIKSYIESKTVYTLPSSIDLDPAYNYDTSVFNTNQYITEVEAH